MERADGRIDCEPQLVISADSGVQDLAEEVRPEAPRERLALDEDRQRAGVRARRGLLGR